jgi:hypothetical protein
MSTRRQVLGWGLRAAAGTVGLGIAGFIGYEWPPLVVIELRSR